LADRTNPDDTTHRQCQPRQQPEYQETVGFFTRHRPPRPIPARDLCFKSETCRPARYSDIRMCGWISRLNSAACPINPRRARQARHVSLLSRPSGCVRVSP